MHVLVCVGKDFKALPRDTPESYVPWMPSLQRKLSEKKEDIVRTCLMMQSRLCKGQVILLVSGGFEESGEDANSIINRRLAKEATPGDFE